MAIKFGLLIWVLVISPPAFSDHGGMAGEPTRSEDGEVPRPDPVQSFDQADRQFVSSLGNPFSSQTVSPRFVLDALAYMRAAPTPWDHWRAVQNLNLSWELKVQARDYLLSGTTDPAKRSLIQAAFDKAAVEDWAFYLEGVQPPFGPVSAALATRLLVARGNMIYGIGNDGDSAARDFLAALREAYPGENHPDRADGLVAHLAAQSPALIERAFLSRLHTAVIEARRPQAEAILRDLQTAPPWPELSASLARLLAAPTGAHFSGENAARVRAATNVSDFLGTLSPEKKAEFLARIPPASRQEFAQVVRQSTLARFGGTIGLLPPTEQARFAARVEAVRTQEDFDAVVDELRRQVPFYRTRGAEYIRNALGILPDDFLYTFTVRPPAVAPVASPVPPQAFEVTDATSIPEPTSPAPPAYEPLPYNYSAARPRPVRRPLRISPVRRRWR